MPDSYETNLTRLIAAAQMSQMNLSIAREMYGKSYFALGVHEKGIVDETTNRMVMGIYRNLTVEAFGTAGRFHIPTPDREM